MFHRRPRIAKGLVVAAATIVVLLPASAAAASREEADKRLVQAAMRELLIARNPERAIRLYFGKTYAQHNPTVPDGTDGLPKKIRSLTKNSSYTPGMIVADGDIVMLHGRYVGWDTKPMVAVDIFRVKAGKLVEHWDVMEEDVPASHTKSGRSMFP